jgi:hypothetical protein
MPTNLTSEAEAMADELAYRRSSVPARRLYNKYLHRYATLIMENETHYHLIYDDELQPYVGHKWMFDVIDQED